MRVNFEVCKLSGTHGYKCKKCNKARTKAIRVEYTVNPFNRNAEGFPKTRSEVYDDVRAEYSRRVSALKTEGATCSKCQ